MHSARFQVDEPLGAKRVGLKGGAGDNGEQLNYRKMETVSVEYVLVNSNVHGIYALLKLKEVTIRELKKWPGLLEALYAGFGSSFAVVEGTPDGGVEFVLSEEAVGIPTPEFERQLRSGEWQAKEIHV